MRTILQRLRLYLTTLFSNYDGVGEEDREENLRRAHREMAAHYSENRERAVEVIRLFHNLEQQVADMEKRIAALYAKAEQARHHGDASAAARMEKEAQSYEPTLVLTREALAQAAESTEMVRDCIRRDEDRIKQKMQEALDLQAQYKRSQQFPRPDAPPPVVDIDTLERFAMFLAALILLFIVLRLLMNI